MVTDHAGMESLFHADPSLFDRELEPGFGCLVLHKDELLGGVTPALVSHTGIHNAARALVDRAMEQRMDAFAPACQQLLDTGWSALRGVDSATLEHACVQTAADVLFRWLFDLEGPPGDRHLLWLKGMFGLKTDRWLTNLLAHLKVRPPKAPVRDYSAMWLQRIRDCEPYAAFSALGAELGVPEEQIAAHLLFAAGFNGAGGTYKTAFPAIAQIYAEPAIREALAAELADFQGDLTALDQLPYLDALMHEVMRLYGRPKQYYRRVLRPTELPTTDGRSFAVEPGDALGLIALVSRQDPAVFERPQHFDPQRFITDPTLKAKVFPFGPPPTSACPYGCAGGANGTAPRLWKAMIASLGRDTDWRLTPEPAPNVDAPTGVDPDSLTWHRS